MIKQVSPIIFKGLYIDPKVKYTKQQAQSLENISTELFAPQINAGTKINELNAWGFDIFCTPNKNNKDIDVYLTTGKPDYSKKNNPFEKRIYLGQFDEDKSKNFNSILHKKRGLYRDLLVGLALTAIYLMIFLASFCTPNKSTKLSPEMKTITNTINLPK